VTPRAVLLSILGLTAVFVLAPRADALPSFAGQTGLPCSACHVGGFGPQLTPFGMNFKATGYTMGGGTGTWSKIPLNLQLEPSYTQLATARPTAPTGYGTNNFTTPGCASFLVAGGKTYNNGTFGIGGVEKVWMNLSNAFVAQTGTILSEGPSDLKLTNPTTLYGAPLVWGVDANNKTTEGDPYNTLYGYVYPYISGTNTVSPGTSLKMSGLGNTVYGLSLFALWNNEIYAQAGVYGTWSSQFMTAIGKSPSSVGYIQGSAPYFRLAWQHSWDTNFLEVGGVFMNIPLGQISGIPNPAAQNTYTDWGFDATYQRTMGPGMFAATSNLLFESQSLGASFGAGKSTYSSDSLTQFRIATSYWWLQKYGVVLAYTATTGSSDPKLYPSAALTGYANGSPNSQAIIAELDWSPWGADTDHTGYPWLNMRVGLQYTYYIQFNGGTTNYDGFGRNASDNNSLLLFTWWAF